ncbi:hypothetical protein [Amycolatopsis sp. H20-H5]|uniref:hypothetical protein n=1 Tax=Amycolatopsis sp. H20-H5 TaxID=3046309 RepID=UPI002DBE8307|nr:hypothetical protein [Amycolatopsis sp. H20-H5]MEC3977045.1 hypothetical protein [Amycolatopsis sp. H20-H5]
MKRALKSPLLWVFVLAGAVLIGVTAFLLADPKTSRGDALKTGGLAGGAIAALYGLWLNDRRRRTEEDRHEIERARISDERFAKAIELLGSDADQVRVGAMHALAGVARTRPEYIQTVLDVLCAYLRRPFDSPDFSAATTDLAREWSAEEKADSNRERLVRRAAERLIRDILPWAGTTGPTFGLNLSDARIDRLNLTARRVGWLGLSRSQILHALDLEDTELSGKVHLDNVECYGNLKFLRTVSKRDITMRELNAHRPVDFGELTHAVRPDVTGARFPEGSVLLAEVPEVS